MSKNVFEKCKFTALSIIRINSIFTVWSLPFRRGGSKRNFRFVKKVWIPPCNEWYGLIQRTSRKSLAKLVREFDDNVVKLKVLNIKIKLRKI